MRKSDFFMISLLLFTLLLPLAEAGVDQQSTSFDNSVVVRCDYRQAQSFRPNANELTRISLYLKRVGSPGNLYVELRTGSADGDIMESWTASQSSIATDYAWHNFTTNIWLSTSTTYYIVLKNPDGANSLNEYLVGCSGSDEYSNGVRKQQYRWWPWPEMWTDWDSDVSGRDLCFKTWTTNQLPVPSFILSYTSNPFEIGVDASSSSDDGVIVQYDWDWNNDGTWDSIDAGDSLTHQYSNYGTYYVRLRVTDNDGATSVSSTKAAVFSNSPPVADIFCSYEGLSVTVDATDSTDPDGSIVSYKWDWDSSNGINWDYPDATGIHQSHIYLSNGTYTITLRVTDDQGATDTESITNYFEVGSNGTNDDMDPSPDDGTGSSGFFDNDWIQFFLNLPTFVIIVIVAIAFIMVAATSFFMKPEIINSVGVVPAVSSLVLGITSIIALIVWYAELETYYVLICIIIIVMVLALDFKYFFGRNRK